MAKLKWEEKAREIQRSDHYELKNLEGGVIVRKKFTVEAQEQIAALRGSLEFGEDGTPINIKSGDIKKFHTAILRAGLLDTNFTNENGEDIVVDEDFIEKLFEYPDLEMEIFSAITEFNRPLAPESSSKSETAQNGSSKDRATDSNPEPSSPTDESPIER